MALSSVSGPFKSANGFRAGASAKDWTLVLQGTVSVNPASIGAGETGDTSLTIAGAAAGDVVIMNPPDALEAGLAYGGAWVSAADTVKVRLVNPTAAPVNGADLTWTYAIFRFA